MNSRVERHLCVIFAADVAGYSRLMRSDEEGTLGQLVIARQKMDELVTAHRGRIVNSVGDSVLAEFASVMDAVQAAIEIQRDLDAAAAGVEPDRRVLFRIGLQLGEVMVRSTDIYGDGVNVAARLQTLAEPGGIVVSGSIYDQLRDRLSIPFVNLGEQAVKNIDRPVPAFGLTPAAIANAPRSEPITPPVAESSRVARRPALIAAGAVTVIAFGLTAWWALHTPILQEPSNKGAQATTVRQPSELLAMSVAVAPLTTPPADAGAAIFVDELRRDVTTALSAVTRDVSVIAFSPEATRHAGIELRESVRSLGARYLVEGNARSQGTSVVVNLQLVGTERGTQAWSKQYKFEKSDSLEVTTIARRKLVGAIAGSVWDAETKRVASLPLDRLTATELLLRGWAATQPANLANVLEGRRLFTMALRLEPRHPRALADQTRLLDWLLDFDPHPDPDRLAREADELTARALNIDGTDPYIWTMRGEALAQLGQWTAALEAGERAIELDPYNPTSFFHKPRMLNRAGKPEESLKVVDRALALKLANAGYLARLQCESYLLMGQANAAVSACEKASGRDTNWYTSLLLVAAYANQGEMARALNEKRTLDALFPGFTIETLRAKRFSEVPRYVTMAETHWYSGLRKAGVPEK
jgi:adenylate cyclase